MRLKFNNGGCLPQGICELTLDEFEKEFVFDKSQRRREIFDQYKIHLNDIEETGCCLNHWIDGSFVTLKENPGDIDTLTEFDGVKVAKLGMHEKIEDIIYNAPLRTNGCCHSFLVYKVPECYGKDYESYVDSKCIYLQDLFPKIRSSDNLKGFIKLKESDDV
jgi:hypothetical protein